MTPDMLRLMTDPEARKDPEFVKAAMAEMRREARRKAFRSIRINNFIIGGVGALMFLGGAGLGFAGVLQILVPSMAFGIPRDLLTILVPIFVGIGALMFGLTWWLRLPSGALLKNGARGIATINQVKGMGMSMTQRSGGSQTSFTKMTIELAVTPENGAPFQIDHTEFVYGGDIRLLQRGATLPVRVSGHDVAIDWDAIEVS